MFASLTQLRYSDPGLWAVLRLWPVTIFLPAVLLLVASLAFVTHLWDQYQPASPAHRDDGAVEAVEAAPSEPPAVPNTRESPAVDGQTS